MANELNPMPTAKLIVDGEEIEIDGFEYTAESNADPTRVRSWSQDVVWVKHPPSVEFTMTFEAEDAEAFMEFFHDAIHADDQPVGAPHDNEAKRHVDEGIEDAAHGNEAHFVDDDWDDEPTDPFDMDGFGDD